MHRRVVLARQSGGVRSGAGGVGDSEHFARTGGGELQATAIESFCLPGRAVTAVESGKQ